MKIAPCFLCIALVALALGCGDDDTEIDCTTARCGCVSGSSVTVRLPDSTAGVVVTSDVLTCSETSTGGISICSSGLEEPFPRTATITAPGYASMTVMMSPVDVPSSVCCPCEGVERYEAEVTLVATAGDGGTGDGGPTCAALGESCEVLSCCAPTDMCSGDPMMCNPGPGS